MEELYQIPNIDSNYLITKSGKVFSKKRNKFLSPFISRNYYRININKRKYMIHRLIASTFIPNPENKPFIDHINTNSLDNRIENLRWSTIKENNNNPNTIRKISGKNHFLYGKHRTDEEKVKMSKANKGKFLGGKNPTARKVINLTTGQIFDCLKDAGCAINKTNSAICYAIKHNKKCNGDFWKYYE